MEKEEEELLQKRVEEVRGKLSEKGYSAFLVTKEENKYYLSGFHSSSYQLVITSDANYVITDFRYREAAGGLSPLYELVEVKAGYSLESFLREKSYETLAVEYQDISAAFYKKITEDLTDTEIVPFDGVVEKIRSIKDETEIEATRQAEHIGDMAFSYILGEIKPGVSEKDIALRLELKMRELGASGLSFDTICVSGVRTSMPHGEPSNKLIEDGDFVTMDFGCKYRGYCSDMTRTVAVGHVSEKQKLVYETVLNAQQAAADTMKAGVKGFDVDKAARDVIYGAGFEGCFGHANGHGTGLEIHEAPVASPVSRDVLETGMIISNEPGIYIPGEFGVRIEDLSVITEDGIIDLTESDKRLIIL